MKVLTKKFYHLSGYGFTFIGLAMIGFAVSTYMQPIQSVDFSAKKEAAIAKCIGDFNSRSTPLNLKMSRIEGTDSIKVLKYGSTNWESSFYGISNVISNCEGMILESFCFGSNCNIQKLTGNTKDAKRVSALYAKLTFDLKKGVVNNKGFE